MLSVAPGADPARILPGNVIGSSNRRQAPGGTRIKVSRLVFFPKRSMEKADIAKIVTF